MLCTLKSMNLQIRAVILQNLREVFCQVCIKIQAQFCRQWVACINYPSTPLLGKNHSSFSSQTCTGAHDKLEVETQEDAIRL